MRDNNLVSGIKPREKQEGNQSGEDKSKGPGTILIGLQWYKPFTLGLCLRYTSRNNRKIIYYRDWVSIYKTELS